MKKIVVLNSGGFDSTTLLLSLREEGVEIHSLYFNYGQPNHSLDSVCARENAEKIGAIHHEINIPEINWTKSKFYDTGTNEYESQYLEMRNLIFLSYATSLAESVEAEAIYCAILKGHGYKDTSKQFIEAFSSVCDAVGLKFIAPYSEFEKSDLFYYAKTFGVGTEYKYISCDTPVNAEPCGKCLDCQSLVEYEDLLKNKYPIMQFFNSGLNTHDSKFAELFRQAPIIEMRILINNDCQLDCEHCYHRNHALVGDILTDDELVNTMIDAVNCGIKSFHFAGKEPLYNERMFTIIDLFRERGYDADFSVVTNGINVVKYADLLKTRVSKVFLSVSDEFSKSNADNVRNSNINKVIKDSLIALKNRGIEYELFYDLTPDNIGHTLSNLEFWHENYDVSSFYVRTIRMLGVMNNLKLSLDSILELHQTLKGITDFNVILNIGCNYFYDFVLCDDPRYFEIIDDIQYCGTVGSAYITPNYRFYAEAYCSKYEGQITLTADGYVLGCAMECSEERYDCVSAGNIREKSLSELICRGKEIAIETNKLQSDEKVINFDKCLVTPIDI